MQNIINKIKLGLLIIVLIIPVKLSCAQEWKTTSPGGNGNYVYLDATNNSTGVGIGDFSGTTPSSFLHVNSNISPAVNSGFGLGEVFRTDAPNSNGATTYDTYWRLLHNGTEKFNIFNKYNDDHVAMGTVQNANMYMFTNGATNTRVTITSAGKVGIGITSPQHILHQDEGNATATYHQFTAGNTTGTGPGDGLIIGVNTSGDAILNQQENGPMQFYTNGTQKVEITSGGRVGIGTNNAQSFVHQHVAGNSNNYHQFTTGRTTQGSNSVGFRIGITDNTGTSLADAEIRQGETAPINLLTHGIARMQLYDAGSSPFNAGYLALGDYSAFAPQSMLHQHLPSNGNTYHTFTTSRSGATATSDGFKIGITDRNSTAEADINQQEAAYMRFYTSATERMAIATGGNIGIGVATPTASLHVDNSTNTNDYTSILTNSATYSAGNTIGLISGTNNLSRSDGGINQGIDLRINGNQTFNKGLHIYVDEDYTSAWNTGGDFYANRGDLNKALIGVAANDNNSSGTATTNYGVQGVGRDATTNNYGVSGEATGSNTTNYGIIGGASGSGSTNYAGYFNGNVFATGTITSSDSNLKTNIQDINNALQIVSQLNPKTYNYKSKAQINANLNLPFGTHAGLIAQDVANVLPSIVSNNIQPSLEDASGNEIYPSLDFLGITYEELIPYLIGAVKELKAQVDAIQPSAGGGTGNVLRNSGSQNVILENSKIPVLYQNQPNPFNSTTTINYFIPENNGKAEMNFYNSTGAFMKSIVISQMGQGTVEVDASNLSSDIYTYSLVVDGKVIDTKRMMKTK